MCCLRYEHEFYVQSRKRFPKEGRIVRTEARRGEDHLQRHLPRARDACAARTASCARSCSPSSAPRRRRGVPLPLARPRARRAERGRRRRSSVDDDDRRSRSVRDVEARRRGDVVARRAERVGDGEPVGRRRADDGRRTSRRRSRTTRDASAGRIGGAAGAAAGAIVRASGEDRATSSGRARPSATERRLGGTVLPDDGDRLRERRAAHRARVREDRRRRHCAIPADARRRRAFPHGPRRAWAEGRAGRRRARRVAAGSSSTRSRRGSRRCGSGWRSRTIGSFAPPMPDHKRGVRALIERIHERAPDDFYEKSYEGLVLRRLRAVQARRRDRRRQVRSPPNAHARVDRPSATGSSG